MYRIISMANNYLFYVFEYLHSNLYKNMQKKSYINHNNINSIQRSTNKAKTMAIQNNYNPVLEQ